MSYFLIVLLLIGSAFFSSAEIAYAAANKSRLRKAAESGSRNGKWALHISENYSKALCSILIGNNLVNIAMSSIGSVMAILIAGEEWTWLATAIITVLVIIFGETMPKIVAKKNANKTTEVK
jgi:Mg2+/Co2+ transporter CorB